MSTELVTKCDMEGCQERKGMANHWFTLWIDDEMFHSATLGTVDFPKDDPPAEKVDACGIDHAQRFYARYMANKTFRTEVMDR